MKRLKIDGTNIDMKIKQCWKCPLVKETGPYGEEWHECSLTESFAGMNIPSDCPLPECT